ncbi:THUMP domain-containing protein, partial [Staphylococcus caprae]|uniref:THUMP domain-containing protein n=1 Tax=Staphylococcus caprae TaxID=29380 RepID=UPI0030C63600
KSISPVLKTEKNDQAMADVAVQLAQSFDNGSTFKIDVMRSDKSYPKDTYELQREIGGAVLKYVEGLTVDVRQPQHEIRVEVRLDAIYI